MAKRIVTFDVPFDYCKCCEVFDPSIDRMYAGNEQYISYANCNNHDICERAEKARKQYEKGDTACGKS